METIQIHRRTAAQYQVETRSWNGVAYWVVPVVMMVEGVHSGSRGPLFHSAGELGRVVAAWNGIPVTIGHPQEGEVFVSANTPQQLEKAVGVVFNARMEGGKLRAEVYVNPTTLSRISPDTFARLQNGQPLEVSVGVFTDEVNAEGQWNGESYTGIATNHRPDHLALLPHEVGACSISDGCGIRVNSHQELHVNEMSKPEISVLKDLNKQGFLVSPVVNAMGMKELVDKVRGAIDAMDNEQRVYFLEEIFEGYFVYRVRVRNTAEEHLYKQMYNIAEDGKVSFEGAPEEVRRDVTYTTMMEMVRTKVPIITNKNQEQMSTQRSSCSIAKVDRIIANSANQFKEADRPWLLTQAEEVLDKMDVPVPFTSPAVDLNQATTLVAQSLQKPEDVLAFLPAGLKEQFADGLQANAQMRQELVTKITAATSQFTADELGAMQTNMLQKLANSVVPAPVEPQGASYAGMGQVRQTVQANGAGTDELMLPLGVSQK